jgi:hypothetical protein
MHPLVTLSSSPTSSSSSNHSVLNTHHSSPSINAQSPRPATSPIPYTQSVSASIETTA